MRTMRNMFRITVIAFAMLFAAGAAGIFGAAGTAGAPAGESAFAEGVYAADDDAYTYTITVYSGKEGYFDGNQNKHSKKLTGSAEYGQSYTIDMADLNLTVKDTDKYYARGIKTAGHDNDEVSQMTYQSYTFTVTKDEAFAVAYGMKGGMVKYTVRYVDENGKSLLSPQEYYGMAGDKPVVSCKYVEGYIPDALNIGKTLVADESKNVFTFTYSKNKGVTSGTDEETDEEDADSDNGGNANANGNGNGNRANAPGAYTAGDGTNNGPSSFVDLDNNETPMANIEGEDTPKDDGSGISGATLGLIGIVAAGILIALALLYFILRRRGDEEE